MALEWVTLEGYIGCIDKGEDASKLSIYAECSEDDGHNVKYELIVDDLPYGLSFNNNGTFRGICQTSEITNYHFSVRATAYNESTNEEFESIEGTFYIATNKPSYSELIVWTNDSIEGSYKCGESILHQFNAYCENNDTIQYIFEDDNYPKGLHLTATGELYGTLLPQEIKAYTFNVKAYTKYASFTKAFTINVISGLGSSAVNCYLKLNHTNDDWYDDLKNQLDLTKTTNTYNDKYSLREFPQIDVAKLHCFDRELLSWMSGVRSENIETMVRVTVNPFPIDAKITITCDGYEQEVIDGVTQNYIIVPINSTIHWKAEYGDNVKEGDAIAVNHLTLNIALVEKKTITILPIPEDAKVSLKCDSYEQVGNQIVVPVDSTVRYIVSQENYNSVMDTVIADEDKDIEVVLDIIPVFYTLTINPTPSDATVTLTAEGFTQIGNSITVESGTTVNYSVSKDGYNSIINSIDIVENKILDIELTKVIKQYTLTINPTPTDATVTLTAEGYTQLGNSITVNENTLVEYTVSKDGYVTQSGSKVINGNETIEVVLDIIPVFYTLTINPTPTDATVILSAEGFTQIGNSITVLENTLVEYTVSKEGYTTQTGNKIVIDNETLDIDLVHTITNVDHLVIKIKFTDGKDLDTGTYFVNLENIPALQDVPELVYNSNSKGVGYLARGSTSMQYTPNTTSSVQNCILAFCGDNQNAGGEQYESIYINTKKLKEQYGSQLPAEVKIKITSCWWNTIGYNKPILSAAGYTGGYMDYSNYVFYNIGGELAGEINNEILNMDLSGTGRSHTRHIANVYWNTITQRVRFEIIPKEN